MDQAGKFEEYQREAAELPPEERYAYWRSVERRERRLAAAWLGASLLFAACVAWLLLGLLR